MKPINKLTREDAGQFACDVEFAHGDGLDTLRLYQTLATRSAIYPGQGTALGLAYVALKLNGEAGEFAEHVGKAMRDDSLIETGHRSEATHEEAFVTSYLTSERRALIVKEVGDVLWYLSAACNELGITLSDAAVQNLHKLADRGERGKLQGSGDER